MIKALHHLDKVTCPVPPVTITRKVRLLTQVIKPAAPNPATLSLIHGNAENWANTTTIILRDHYRENIENQVMLFSLLPGPEWQLNYDIALAWARRHFGPRLLQETLDEAHARLCHTRGTVGLSSDPLPGRTPSVRTPPRPSVPRTVPPATDPSTVTAQVHAPRDGGRLLVTPPSPPIGPSINAVQREGGSLEPQPDAEDGPSPVIPPVSFFPPFSGPDTPPTPPMAQRTTLRFFPPAASTPTRRSTRRVNTNTNINNPRLSTAKRRHVQRVWKECLGT